VSAEKGDIDLSSLKLKEEIDRFDNLKKMYSGVCDWWSMWIKTDSEKDPSKWINIQDVKVSKHLVEKPISIVSSQWGYSPKMEKAFAAQGQDLSMSASKTLEINPEHPVVYKIWQAWKENKDDPGVMAMETAQLLTQAAIVASGFRIDDATVMVESVHELLKLKRGVDANAEVTQVEVDIPAAEEGDDDDDDAEAESKTEEGDDDLTAEPTETDEE